MVIKYFIAFMLLCFCLCACRKESLNADTTIIGKTFSSPNLSITFISGDSVFFQTRNMLYILNGKSKYEIHNDTIVIKSPYGKRLEPEETIDSYMLSFVGYLKSNRIDQATFTVIGPYEKEQLYGIGIDLFVE